VLEKDKAIVCQPKGPLRVFGFRSADLEQMFAMIDRDASTEDSKRFLSSKAKTCGEVRVETPIRPGGGGEYSVSAHYAVEPHGAGGCKLRRIASSWKLGVAGTTATDEPAPEDSANASSKPIGSTPAPAPQPARSPPAPTPGSASSCGCRTGARDSGESAWLWLGLLAFAGLRRALGSAVVLRAGREQQKSQQRAVGPGDRRVTQDASSAAQPGVALSDRDQHDGASGSGKPA
jgi:MYXO-CTERM domain-containing protein